MRGIYLLPLLFLGVFAEETTTREQKMFNCSNIETKSAWREIFTNCENADRIESFNDYVLEVNREDPDEINRFLQTKVYISMGFKVHQHMDFSKKKITYLNFSKLEEIYIQHHQGLFEISENDELTSIYMPNLRKIHIQHGQFVIFRNKKLVNFTIAEHLKKNESEGETNTTIPDEVKNLEISGNNLINKGDNDHILKIFEPHINKGRHVQEEGECNFYRRPDSDLPKDKINGLQHLSELDNCKYVYGNLLFSEGASGDNTNVHLSKVQGCVEIRNTTLKTLDFLDKTDVTCASWSRITDNPFVENCKFRPNFKFSSQNFNVSNNCKGTCMKGETMYVEKQCEFVKEGIEITEKNKLYELERLRKARVVEGVISVKNTVFHEMNWFSKLEIVKAPLAKGPLIDIMKNKALRTLDLFALKNITAPSGLKVHIRIRDNRNYAVPEDLYQHLLKVVGGKEKRLDVDRQLEVEKKQMEIEEKEQEERDSLNMKIGLGIGIPAGVLLFVGIVVAATVVGVKTSKNRKKNKKDKKGDKEKGGKNKVHPGGSPTDGAKFAANGPPPMASVVLNMDDNEGVNENRSDVQRPSDGTAPRAASKNKSIMPQTRSSAPTPGASEPETPNEEANDNYEIVGTVKPITVKAVTAKTIMQSKVKGPSTNYVSVNVKTKAPATKAVTAPPISASKMDDNYVVIPKG